MSRRTGGVTRVTLTMTIVAAVVVAACGGGGGLPTGEPVERSPSTIDTEATEPATDGGDPAADPPKQQVGPIDVTLNPSEVLGAFDRRLLGTNVAAWLGQQRFEREEFLQALAASGTTMIRMPGGSWSNSYDWLACEMSDDSGCFWTWAARPADFARLLVDSGLDGMWTVSINETAEQAAALVAYFNGDPDDQRRIGVDRDGVDWQTVGTWAALRRDNGQPEPIGMQYWEVGNEVYAAKQSAGGSDCAPFGWEDVWTCDGAEYVNGDDAHDGYLQIRDAMRAVDPSISVGAVGVVDPSGWSGWGTKVIDDAGEALDFYVIHHYGFDSSPSVAQVMESPSDFWPSVLPLLADALSDQTPIALTEHNLVAVPSADTERTITHASNAIFLADTIGQLALGGVNIANQWDFASGTADSGTNYGLVDADSLRPFPTFFTLALWSRFGDELIDVSEHAAPPASLGVYAGRSGDIVTAMLVNRTAQPLDLTIRLAGASLSSAQLDSVYADDPSSPDVMFNDVFADDVSVVHTDATPLEVADGVAVELAPWSVNLVELVTDS